MNTGLSGKSVIVTGGTSGIGKAAAEAGVSMYTRPLARELSSQGIRVNAVAPGMIRTDIIIRMPIIPGYTDDEKELRQAAEALSQIRSIRRVDLLPVHQFGRVKYEQIGMEYTVDPTLMISEERQQAIKTLFEGYGFKTQIGG